MERVPLDRQRGRFFVCHLDPGFISLLVDTRPSGIGRQVSDPVGSDLAEIRIDEVIHPDFFGTTSGCHSPPRNSLVSDEFFLFRADKVTDLCQRGTLLQEAGIIRREGRDRRGPPSPRVSLLRSCKYNRPWGVTPDEGERLWSGGFFKKAFSQVIFWKNSL